MKDSKVKIGELLTDYSNPRLKDAIHVPVASVESGADQLYPGQLIKLINAGYYKPLAVPATPSEAVGVVDPWLEGPVRKGEVFWCLVKPGTIEDLCHTWKHGSFPDYETMSGEAYDDCRGCY